MKKSIALILAVFTVFSAAVNVSADDMPFISAEDMAEYRETENDGLTGEPSDPEELIPVGYYTDDEEYASAEPVSNVNDGSTGDAAGVTVSTGEYTVTYSSETVSVPTEVPSYDTGTAEESSEGTGAAVVTAKTENPKITASVDSKGNLVLEWSKVKNADKYIVYRLSGNNYNKIGTTKKNSFTIKDLKVGKTYKFMVRYTIGNELSKPANSFRITVTMNKKSANPVVKAEAVNGKVKLKWNAVDGAESYTVYRVTKNNTLKKVKTTSKTSIEIKQKPDDKGYAVTVYVNGRWTKVSKRDIVSL